MPPRIRRASLANAAQIAGVHVRSWQGGYRGLLPAAVLDTLSVEDRERFWRGLLAEDEARSFTLVAELGQRVMGFCSIAAPSRDEDAGDGTCEVAAIYVEPDAWRTGVGGALLVAALDAAGADGWREATLWVFDANDRAVAFYRRLGFVPDGAEIHDEGLAQTEIRMRARLAGVPNATRD